VKKAHPWFALGCLLLLLLMLVGCQKAEPPAPQAAATPAAPPPPAPPPETSQGTLMKVERADKTMVQVATLNLRARGGIAFENQEQKAAKGKTFVILHFEGKAKPGQAKTWLADAAGKKYTEGFWYAPKKEKDQKDTAQVSYEIPADSTGLVWHDNKQPYKLEPIVVAVPPEPEKSPAGGKQ